MKLIRITVIASLLLIIFGGYAYQKLKQEGDKLFSEDPRVWETDIAAFEAADQNQPPPQDAIVFIGSSSIRFWDTLSEDMQPLVAFGRGFGGAKIQDVSYYTDRIVRPYQPRAVVVYIGANDFNDLFGNQVKTYEQGVRWYRVLMDRLKQAAPGKPIYFLALRPNQDNAQLGQLVEKINAFLATSAMEDDRLHFIDANAVFYDDSGKMDDQYMSWDTIHINDRGYKVWGTAIKQRLQADLGR